MAKKGSTLTADRVIDFVMNNKSIFLLLFMVILAQSFSSGLFLRPGNISTIFRQCAIPIVIALGYTYNLTAGSLDLSVGHIISLCCVVYNDVVRGGRGVDEYAQVVETPGMFILALVTTLAVGVLCGFINAFMINKFSLVPFILTMGTGQIYRSIAMVMCGGVSYTVRFSSMKYIGQGFVFGLVPFSLVIFFVLTIVAAIIMYRTKFGRNIVATGGNMEAARVSGVPIVKTKIFATMIMGFHLAVAAIILTGRVAVAQPGGGTGMEMDAIASVVIGGTLLSGGKPNVIGAVFGALIIASISNMMNLLGVDAYLQWAVKGVIIIIAIALDNLSVRIMHSRMLRASNV